MATQSTILARRIPWTEEPGGLQFMGSQKSSDTTQPQELMFIAVPGPLTVVASLAVERSLQGTQALQLQHTGSEVAAPRLQSPGSIVVAHGLSCSTACGIFPDQRLKSCLLHWQMDSLPLSHQGSPQHFDFIKSKL